ncbi:potassium channel subfamily K member 18-like [Ptychodera flava]|uniref:potassium channel subfamily K member 18-like n=1 Tax=Ptychodera flava TaxID=63121 RepID=UPI00396A31AB
MATSRHLRRRLRSVLCGRSGACLFLSMIWVSYVTLGAAVFCFLEDTGSSHSTQSAQQLDGIRLSLRSQLDKVCANDTADRMENVLLLLNSYEELVNFTSQQAEHQELNMLTAGLLCVAVITTVGYGYTVPLGTPGRLFCIFYAILGIPVNLLFLSKVGQEMGTAARSAVSRLRRRTLCRNGRENKNIHGRDNIGNDDSYQNWILRNRYTRGPSEPASCLDSRQTTEGGLDSAISKVNVISDTAVKDRQLLRDSSVKTISEMVEVRPQDPTNTTTQDVEISLGVEPTMSTCQSLEQFNFLYHAGSDIALTNTAAVEQDISWTTSIPRAKRRTNTDTFTVTESHSRTQVPSFPDDVENSFTIQRKTETNVKLSSEGPNEIEIPSEDSVDVPVTILMAVLVAYVLLGAAIFGKTQEWGFFTALYFCVITLTTIGFGDVELYKYSSDEYYKRVLVSLSATAYIIIGMALLSMSINLTLDRILAACKRIMKRFESCKAVTKS